MISVLVVDDSVVIRRLITEALAIDSKIQVAGTAENGNDALAKVEQLRPDVVTLDIEMPVMDGLEALRVLRPKYPKLPIIMFSTVTVSGAAATLDALAAGATDYVTKPANVGSIRESIRSVREQLIPRIHALCPHKAVPDKPAPGRARPGRPAPDKTGSDAGRALGARRPAGPAPTGARTRGVPPGDRMPPGDRTPPRGPLRSSPGGRPATTDPRDEAPPGSRAPRSDAARTRPRPAAAGDRPKTERVEAVAIGCSTGGPDALTKVLRALPAKLPVPVLVVQHMPPVFTKMFAERLDRLCALTVVEAGDNVPVWPGTVYIAPGDLHLEVFRRGAEVATRLHSGPPENFCRPAVDVLFRSIAGTYGRNALAVVLTGMGHDGRIACELLHSAGAEIVVQDEASSVVWGMPGSVTHAGLADAVLPLEDLAQHLIARITGGRRLPSMEVTR